MEFNQGSLDLEHFINRTSMYIFPVDRYNIVSFIHGYEMGIQNSSLTIHIKDYLIEKYNINHSNQGWPSQIEEFSKMNEIEWIDAFRTILKELFDI